MISKEDTNKKKLCIRRLLLFVILLLSPGCNLKTMQKNMVTAQKEVKATEKVKVTEEVKTTEELKATEKLLSKVLGEWYVVECIGDAVPNIGREPRTIERVRALDKYNFEVLSVYLYETIKISTENSVAFYPSEKMTDDQCESWDALFDLYRQQKSWEWVTPPFSCIHIHYNEPNTDVVDYFDFIIDSKGNAILYADGLFFWVLNMNEIPEDPLSKVAGKWYVAEYLGQTVPSHGGEPTTEEQILSLEKWVTETKKSYLGTSIEINKESVIRFYPRTELGYYYSDWDELFTIYRQPNHLGKMSPPFFCIKIYYKDDDTYFDFIVDSIGNAALEVRGSFFRLEKEK